MFFFTYVLAAIDLLTLVQCAKNQPTQPKPKVCDFAFEFKDASTVLCRDKKDTYSYPNKDCQSEDVKKTPQGTVCGCSKKGVGCQFYEKKTAVGFRQGLLPDIGMCTNTDGRGKPTKNVLCQTMTNIITCKGANGKLVSKKK
ncbi:hypothetical protein DFH28DRAFT_1104570 [Melampsora americana]|nr:hypothetical protein DFH28DRAFT_1104570 [Melampsora americana]